MIKIGIIADDLSGACDAAAEFASRNFSCMVDIAGTLEDIATVDVVSVSTETRTASPTEAQIKVVEIFDRMMHSNVQFIYKKIDSTLRGNCRTEINVLLSAAGLERAFILPAFPETRRCVRSGSLYVDEDSSPTLYIPSVLGEEHLQCIGAHECSDHLCLGKGLFVVDAETRSDMKRAARCFWNQLEGTLPVGSAGFAAELAELMRNGCEMSRTLRRSHPFVFSSQPIAFVVGSTHGQTQEQREFLRRHRKVEVICLKPGWDFAARHSLLRGSDILLDIDCNCIEFPDLWNMQRLTNEGLISAFIVTGGYTAHVLCAALKARAIRICSSLLPGAAMGILIGAGLHSIPIVTKSGGFGACDALAHVADLLRDGKAA